MADYPFNLGYAGITPYFNRRRRTPLEREMGGPLSIAYGGANVEGVPTTVRASSMPFVEGIPIARSVVRGSSYENPDAIDFNAMTAPSGGGLLYNDPNFRVTPEGTRSGSTEGLLGIDIGIPEPEIPTDFSSRLGDVRRQSGLAQLSGMLMGLATPTRRGESRLMNSVALGQKMGREAMAEGKDILAQEMSVDKYQRARDKAIRQRDVFRSLFGEGGQAQIDTSYRDSFDFQKLPEAQRQFYDDAMAQQQYGRALMQAGDTEAAKAAFEQSKALQEQAYSGFLNPAERVKAQSDQRETWRKTEYSKRNAVVEAYNQIATLAQQGKGLADYASFIAFIKGLDPTSVVREGEVSMAGSFISLQNRLENAYKKAESGGFTNELRQELVDVTRAMAELATKDYGLSIQRQTPLIERDRLDPRQIVVELTPMIPVPRLGTSSRSRVDNVLTALENQ